MQTQQAFAAVNGTRLHYEMAGSGQPLVFIHGFTLDRRMWDEQFKVFAQRYQVVRYDVRGFGQSALPDGEPYERADDLKALLGHLGIQRAHIIGLSMGGMIAIDFAVAYPQMTVSLIPVDSALDGHQWSKQWDETVIPIWTAGRAGDVATAKRLWLDHALFAPAREQPQVGARLQQMVAEYSGWHWVNRNPHRDRTPSSLERISEIHAPVLIVLGERDLPDFHVIADTLQKNIPAAHKAVIPAVGHMSPMEDSNTFNEVALDFLSNR